MVLNFQFIAVTHMFSWYSTSQFLGSTLKIPFFLENGQVENHTLAAYGLRFMNLWSK